MLLLMPLFVTSDIDSDQPIEIDMQESDVYVRTSDLVFRIPTSKIPQYFFWLNQEYATTYRVQFDLMFEVTDVNNDDIFTEGTDIIIPGSFQSLPQMGWVTSEIIEEETSEYTITSFNLTGSEDGANNPHINDLTIQFRNHIMTNDENTELKFDVVINNYEWKNSSLSTMLVLAFKIHSSDGTHDGSQGNSTMTEFGDAYVYSESEATDKLGIHESAEVHASMSVGNGANTTEIDSDTRFYLSYTHFDGDLVHDPTIGINKNTIEEKLFVADELSIRTPTSNVPFFFFWNTAEDSITYKIQFDAMFEVFDQNADGIYNTDTETMIPSTNIPLALYDWNISDVITETKDSEIIAYHFNLTGSPENNPTIGSATIQFRNHISVLGNDSTLKFDVLVNGYEWTNTSNDALLVLSYKLLSNDPAYDGTPKLYGNETKFGNAFFNSTELAYNNSGSDTNQVQAKMSIGVGDPTDPVSTNADARIYVAYSHFDGDLMHDPILGLSSTNEESTTSDDTSTSESSTTTSSSAVTPESTEDDSYVLLLPIIITSMIMIPLFRKKIAR